MQHNQQEAIVDEIKALNRLDINLLRPYLLYTKQKQLGALRCEECGEADPPESFEFHHVRYALDVSIDDLLLLCAKCHRSKPKGASPTSTEVML
jgi:hypothetical protein